MMDFVDYLDRWMQDQGFLMHSTTLERIADGAEEYFAGAKRPFAQWVKAPNTIPPCTGEST